MLSQNVTILLSIIWGFGIAILFKRVCQNNECIITKVPPNFNEKRNLIFDNNKCYKLVKYASPCIY